MGMSASQARLLSLMARMSDVEYEGQQINQQRLVLSNKMNEVMEKMTNMDVPAPPSKQDFLYNTYSGKTRNGKKISATMNDDGTFNVTKAVAGLIVEDAGLQNITSGAQIEGNPEAIPYTTDADGYHDCKGSEAAKTYRSTSPLSDFDPFDKYEASDFVRIYDEGTGAKKTSQMLNDYPDGTKAQAFSNIITVKVPLYNYKITHEAGYYVDGQNLGTDTSKIHQEEIPQYEDVTDPATGETEQVYTHSLYTYSGNGSTTNEMTEPITDWEQYKEAEEGEFVPAGYKEVIKSGTLTSKEDFDKLLEEPFDHDIYPDGVVTRDTCQNLGQIGDLPDGFDSIALNGDAIFATYANASGRELTENDFRITECYGADPAGQGITSSGYYRRADGSTHNGTLEGAWIIDHNKKVAANLNTTFFYVEGGKWKTCKGSDAEAKYKSGVELYAEDKSGSGQGITDQIVNSAKLEGLYIYNDMNQAYLIGAGGKSVEEAYDLLTDSGWKLMKQADGGSMKFTDPTCIDQITVNGSKTVPVTQMVTDTDETFQKALTGLRQSFPDEWEQFSVIINSSGSKTSYSFCRTDELVGNATTGVDNQVRVYNPANGTYDETIENVEPTYDENGYLKEVRLPNGEVVSMEITQQVDEIEYDKAMNKYNIEKIEYDKEVNELNKQTSIYQRQDKTLELKLTRLDTERNALNTEIDAVKKVIQDATEKGFKTFSG